MPNLMRKRFGRVILQSAMAKRYLLVLANRCDSNSGEGNLHPPNRD